VIDSAGNWVGPGAWTGWESGNGSTLSAAGDVEVGGSLTLGDESSAGALAISGGSVGEVTVRVVESLSAAPDGAANRELRFEGAREWTFDPDPDSSGDETTLTVDDAGGVGVEGALIADEMELKGDTPSGGIVMGSGDTSHGGDPLLAFWSAGGGPAGLAIPGEGSSGMGLGNFLALTSAASGGEAMLEVSTSSGGQFGVLPTEASTSSGGGSSVPNQTVEFDRHLDAPTVTSDTSLMVPFFDEADPAITVAGYSRFTLIPPPFGGGSPTIFQSGCAPVLEAWDTELESVPLETTLFFKIHGDGDEPRGTVETEGDLLADGNITGGSKTFRIDHPLDPENKLLYHTCVESPDMMNVYNGNAFLDAEGAAWVELPEYFEALNREFRYQLTCVGGFAPVYVEREIEGNRFRIAGGSPGLKVSWQVTGVRQDPYAEAHRTVVEVDKPEEERGTYLHAAEWGQPESLQRRMQGSGAQRMLEKTWRTGSDVPMAMELGVGQDQSQGR